MQIVHNLKNTYMKKFTTESHEFLKYGGVLICFPLAWTKLYYSDCANWKDQSFWR